MATDLAVLLDDLLRFYPFDGKVRLAFGAGGGQLAGCGLLPLIAYLARWRG